MAIQKSSPKFKNPPHHPTKEKILKHSETTLVSALRNFWQQEFLAEILPNKLIGPWVDNGVNKYSGSDPNGPKPAPTTNQVQKEGSILWNLG